MVIAVPHRPFATELYTGLQVPGGFFETSLGQQNINAHFISDVNSGLAECYIESVSDPNILIVPVTHQIASLLANGPHMLTWQADFANAQPGVHRVSFVVQTSSGR